MSDRYAEWVSRLMESWRRLDGWPTAKLFTSDVAYYEVADGPPCENWKAVKELWRPVPTNQRAIEYSIELVVTGEHYGVINWRMTRDLQTKEGWVRQHIDGVFLTRVSHDGLCNYFKQWRTVRTEQLP